MQKARSDRLRELLTSRRVHAIVFAGAVEVSRLLGSLDVDEHPALYSIVLATTGESARAALVRSGFEPAITMTDAGLPEVLAATLGRLSGDERA